MRHAGAVLSGCTGDRRRLATRLLSWGYRRCLGVANGGNCYRPPVAPDGATVASEGDCIDCWRGYTFGAGDVYSFHVPPVEFRIGYRVRNRACISIR